MYNKEVQFFFLCLPRGFLGNALELTRFHPRVKFIGIAVHLTSACLLAPRSFVRTIRAILKVLSSARRSCIFFVSSLEGVLCSTDADEVTHVKFTVKQGAVAASIIGARAFVQVFARTCSIIKLTSAGRIRVPLCEV